MPLTPANVHEVAFKKPSIGKRGYDEEEVDAFLDEVERELARLVEENEELRAQMERGLGAGGGGGGDLDRRTAARLADIKAQLEQAYREKVAAENNVRAVQAELERRQTNTGGMPILGGDDRQSGVLMMAQRTADGYLTDARREADKYLSEARAKADDLTRQARAEADTIESEAHQFHQQAIGNLNAERTALLHGLEDLANMEQDYRSRLRAHVLSQLRDMGEVPG